MTLLYGGKILFIDDPAFPTRERDERPDHGVLKYLTPYDSVKHYFSLR